MSSMGIGRRELIRSGAGLLMVGASLTGRSQPAMQLLENTAGGYRALPVALPYSGAVLAMQGFEIVHAIIKPWLPLAEAFDFIERHLKTAGRPIRALCGMELRIPKQLSVADFGAFNRPYIERLRTWQLIHDRFSMVTRTNVVDALIPTSQPSVHAFSYAVPSALAGPSFCTSGSPDLDAQLRPIADGDVSVEGMRKKLQHVAKDVMSRLEAIGMNWDAATHTDLCVAQPIGRLWEEVLGPAMTPATRQGVRVYRARPPIVGSEVELECRAIRQELVLSS